jgi:hypothetical protein
MGFTVHPHRLHHFGVPARAFVLITNATHAGHVKIVPDGAYESCAVVTYDQDDDFNAIVQRLPRQAHVLVISPKCGVAAPPPALLGTRQLSSVRCHSTPTSHAALQQILTAIEQTNHQHQQTVAERLFTLANDSPQLTLVDPQYGTEAVLQHWRGDHEWRPQAGPLTEWGSHQTVPAGEISLVPGGASDAHGSASRSDRRLLLDGEIALRGYPIVHAGEATRARHTQAHLYTALEPLSRHAIIATVCAGAITQLRATEPQAAPLVTLFQELLARHPHYRTIAEIGLSFNDAFEPLPGNHAANEVWGGRYGTVHIGIGPQPFIPYHVTLGCPGLTLMGKDRHVLVGPPPDTEVEGSTTGILDRCASAL